MDYTEMLKQEFQDRKNRRPMYSERAFARDLKVSPGYISLLFRGQRALSAPKGLQIAQRLGWSEEKTADFLGRIQKQSLASAQSKSKTLRTGVHKFSELEMDRFRFIADLHHIAALTLIQSREKITAPAVAAELGLTLVETELILARLLRFGVIRQNSAHFASTKQSLELKEVSSDAIRSFHRQSLQKAEAAIDEQDPKIRNLSSLTISFDPARMEEAKSFVTRFLKSFEKKFGNAKAGEIYQINSQLFRLTKGKS